MDPQGNVVSEMIDYVIEGGLGAIGTPEDVIEQINRLVEQSNGGFGSYLMLAHEWANTEATKRSCELIAKYVMPEFQGQAHATRDAVARAKKLRNKLRTEQQAALDAMTEKHAAEIAALASNKSSTG
jgi:limonene 1,2-monooxygenase